MSWQTLSARVARLAAEQVKVWTPTRLLSLLVGLVGIGHAVRFFVLGYTTSKSGDFFVAPLMDWVPVSHSVQLAVVPLFLLASAFVAANQQVRVAAATAALCLSYILFSDWQAFHHSTFLGLNMFMLVAWMASPDPHQRWAASWGMRALAFAVYIFAGIHKAFGPGFREGFVIEQLLDTTALGKFAHHAIPGLVPFSVWTTVVLELLLPFFLLFPKARLCSVLIGLCFHVGMLTLTGRGSVFHFYLPIAYLAFFMPSRLADFIDCSPHETSATMARPT